MKVSIDAKGLKYLAQTAKQAGTQNNWIDIALEWIDAAEAEIVKLRENLKIEEE